MYVYCIHCMSVMEDIILDIFYWYIHNLRNDELHVLVVSRASANSWVSGAHVPHFKGSWSVHIYCFCTCQKYNIIIYYILAMGASTHACGPRLWVVFKCPWAGTYPGHYGTCLYKCVYVWARSKYCLWASIRMTWVQCHVFMEIIPANNYYQENINTM